MGVTCVVSWAYVPEEGKVGFQWMSGIKAEVAGTYELFVGGVAGHLSVWLGITVEKDSAGHDVVVFNVANCKLTLIGLWLLID